MADAAAEWLRTVLPPADPTADRTLTEVTDRTATGAAIDRAGPAAELGYADRAHLVRAVTAFCGEPPTCYAARYGRRTAL